MANWLTRVLPSWGKRAAEGAYRPGPYLLPDGWLSAKAGKYLNWWQMGYSPTPYGDGGAMVEACVSAYAQTTAMCPGDHWRRKDDGGRERVTTSALSRILRRPNDYQSISDFLLNLTRRLYSNGEAFALAIRNDRQEATEMHLMPHGQVMIGSDGSIFYYLSGNEIAERRFDTSMPIPAREVLHVRLHTPRHPMKGVSPILATTLELAMSGAAMNQQISFYLNQARPSFMLETDQQLTAEQTRDLRARWNEQTQGDNAGGTPILSWGLKAKPVSADAKDGELVDMLKMSDQNVALAFRMPLQVLGLGGTTFASTEALMSFWKATGLGFCLNHIEEAFGLFFRLQGFPYEYLEFDTKALLRSNFKEMIEGLARSTISGIHSSDEARNELDLPETAGGFGKMPRVQQQVVPLDWHEKNPAPQPKPAPAPATQDEEDDAGRSTDDFSRQIDDLVARHSSQLH